jgi:hypothetical protein
MLVGLYYNKDSREQQEIVEVMPHSVKPLVSFDQEALETLSINTATRNPNVLKKFIEILISENANE